MQQKWRKKGLRRGENGASQPDVRSNIKKLCDRMVDGDHGEVIALDGAHQGGDLLLHLRVAHGELVGHHCVEDHVGVGGAGHHAEVVDGDVRADGLVDALLEHCNEIEDDRAVLRALHFFGENARVEEAVEVIEKQEYNKLLELMNE